MTANESLRDSMISHAVYFERYKTHEVNQLFRVLDEANKAAKVIVSKTDGAATKARYQAIMKEIAVISSQARETMDKQLTLGMNELVSSEINFQNNAINKSVGVDLEMTLPAPKQVFTAATFMPFSESATFETMLSDIDKNLYSTWDMAVRVGYMTGETAQSINRRVLGSISGLQTGTMAKLKRGLEANTRTLISHYAEQSRNAVYRENESLFSGYQRLETLDPRTCLVCGAIDRKVYKTLDDAPSLIHMCCRGLYIPIIKGWEDLGIPERASVDGVVAGDTDYETWLKAQSPERQKDILGPSKYELYKNGASLTSFVVDGKTLSLEKWREVEGNQKYMTNRIETRNLSSKYSSLNIQQKDKSVSDWLIKKGVESKRERALVTDLNGNILSIKKGQASSVGLSGHLRTVLNNAEPNSLVFYHNHPRSSSFSINDIAVACRTESISEIKAIGHDGTIYSLDVKKNRNVSDEKLLKKWESSEIAARKVYDALYYTGKMTSTEADKGFFQFINEKMADSFGWKYSVKENVK